VKKGKEYERIREAQIDNMLSSARLHLTTRSTRKKIRARGGELRRQKALKATKT